MWGSWKTSASRQISAAKVDYWIHQFLPMPTSRFDVARSNVVLVDIPGIGKQLERAACDWASTQGLLRLQLLADSSNSPALNFYSKAGWNNTSLIALRKAIT